MDSRKAKPPSELPRVGAQESFEAMAKKPQPGALRERAAPGDAGSDGPGTLLTIRDAADFQSAFAVPHETIARLETYAALLRQWQKAVNLVAPATLDEVWRRHFADCAQLVPLQPEARTWLDLGSGAGFPGLVIAILLANHENRIVHLVESNSRKCAFLHEVARRTGVRAVIHEGRIEDVARGWRVDPVDVITARALAPLDRLLSLAEALFAERTVGLFLKGREAGREIEEARGRRGFSFGTIPSRVHGEGCIVEVRRGVVRGNSS
jgi:16S rRNA (guanine527-N7)-methyltransferase